MLQIFVCAIVVSTAIHIQLIHQFLQCSECFHMLLDLCYIVCWKAGDYFIDMKISAFKY
jgi:hypothetical protein